MTGSEGNHQNLYRNVLKKPELPWWLTWPFIITILFFFWPVGIFLIWKRVNINNRATLNGGKTTYIIGLSCLIIAGLSFLFGLSEGFSNDDVLGIIIFGTTGAALAFTGNKKKKISQKYKKYKALIVNQRLTSLDNIAALIPTTYEEAVFDIQKMIDNGYLPGVYINYNERVVVLPQNNSNASFDMHMPNSATRVVICKSCGASNKLSVGATCECQYCGSYIQTE